MVRNPSVPVRSRSSPALPIVAGAGAAAGRRAGSYNRGAGHRGRPAKAAGPAVLLSVGARASRGRRRPTPPHRTPGRGDAGRAGIDDHRRGTRRAIGERRRRQLQPADPPLGAADLRPGVPRRSAVRTTPATSARRRSCGRSGPSRASRARRSSRRGSTASPSTSAATGCAANGARRSCRCPRTSTSPNWRRRRGRSSRSRRWWPGASSAGRWRWRWRRCPEEQRTAIVLKEYHGLTFQEIADLQGCPLSTVKTRLYQGLSVAAAAVGRRAACRRPTSAGTHDEHALHLRRRRDASSPISTTSSTRPGRRGGRPAPRSRARRAPARSRRSAACGSVLGEWTPPAPPLRFTAGARAPVAASPGRRPSRWQARAGVGAGSWPPRWRWPSAPRWPTCRCAATPPAGR